MRKKIKRDITILAIGDRADYDAYQKFDYEKTLFARCGFDYVTTNYMRFLDGRIPQLKTEKIIIFLFFPFSYWNKHIEHKNYRGIYGNRTFCKKFSHFWDMVENKVKKEFAGKEILFVNNPHLCGAYRDKLTVIKKLAQFHIPQPRLYSISTIRGIQSKLISGHGLYLKPRYGSMGKGITFLSRFDWQTNFIFRDSKIISRRSDHGWKFRNITGNHEFLRQLLERDILIQEAVDPPILNGDKVDLRIYTFFDKVIYVYPRKNSLDKVTTNISQGGHGAPRLLKVLPEYMVSKAKREALRVSKALNISLAGIDIVPDRNSKEVFVIDVNVFSGFPKRRTFDLAARLAGELGQLRQEGKLFSKNSDTMQY